MTTAHSPESTVWRGYRWPLRASPGSVAGQANTPAWHWVVVGVVLCVAFGIVDLNEAVTARLGPINIHGNDLIFAPAAALAALQYLDRRRRPALLVRGARAPVVAMVLFVAVAVMMTLRGYEEAPTGFGSLQLLIRVVPFFATFFLLAAFIATADDLKKLLRLWLALTAVGTVIVIAQSLRGPDPLFGGSLLDEIVVPPGPQIVDTYGVFHRSNFPIAFAAVWSFFYCLSLFALHPSPRHAGGALFFSAAFILNMSRGLYAGVALAGVGFLIVMSVSGRIRMRPALASVAVVAGLIMLIAYLGLGGLDQAVVGRTTSALQDYRQRSGTWESRLRQVDTYRDLEPEGADLLLGYGYSGQRSGLELPFIEFGPIDLVYRAGVAGTAIIVVTVGLVLRFAVSGLRRRRSGPAVCTAAALWCSLVSELGGLPSYDHLLYAYYAAVLGSAVAVATAADALDAGDA